MTQKRPRLAPGLLLAAALALAGGAALAGPYATLTGAGNSVAWTADAAHAGAVLTLKGPGGAVTKHRFAAGESPSIGGLADGHYKYELLLLPQLGAGIRERLAEARASGRGDEVAEELRAAGLLPRERMVASGHFMISGGSLVDAAAVE